MKSIKRRSRRSSLQLDVTPMADIVFLLLIFFMLSSTFISQPGIDIKLPKARAREIRAEKQLIVTITRENEIFVNKSRITYRDLEKEIRLRLARMTDKVVVIRADASVKHGTVVEALDKARSAGAHKLAIATQQNKK